MTLSVPAGFTRAVVQVFGLLQAINRASTSNYLRAQSRLTTSNRGVSTGRQLITSIPGSGGLNALTVMVQREYTDLPNGTTFTGELLASADYGTLDSDVFNACTVTMMATFSR